MSSPDVTNTMVVLKAFSFMSVPTAYRKAGGAVAWTPTERHFVPGSYQLDPTDPADAIMLHHPWIIRDFADGYVQAF